MYVLSDPNGAGDSELPADRPHPYTWTERIQIKNLTTFSGKAPQISHNTSLNQQVNISIEN
jgi:hypothetical protein